MIILQILFILGLIVGWLKEEEELKIVKRYIRINHYGNTG